MNLIRKIMQCNTGNRFPLLPVSLDQKDLYAAASSNDPINKKAEAEDQGSCGIKYFIDLPKDVQMEILSYLSYDDTAKLRRTCKLMNALCSQLLNQGFRQLGIDIDKQKLLIKRELPRRESMRRSHPLSRFNDAYAGLDTRFSIMLMTYRKFIDSKATCFIPGKVLDEFFRILDILKKSYDRDGTLGIDIHELLKDLRDLSSMAMEHFEEHVQPSLTSTAPARLSSTYFMSIQPFLRPPYSRTSSPPKEICVDCCEWRKNITDKLAQQEKIIRKQNLEIISLKSCVCELVVVCNELSTSTPTVKNGIKNHLHHILDMLLDESTATCEPSTSGSGIKGMHFSRERKRICSDEDSHIYDGNKRARHDDRDDDESTTGSLI